MRGALSFSCLFVSDLTCSLSCRQSFSVFLLPIGMQPSTQSRHPATNTGSAIQLLSPQGVDAALEEGTKLAT